MSIAGGRLSTALALFCLLMTFVAQTASLGLHAQDQSHRKLVTSVAPKYPEELKNQLRGRIVRLNVVIAPDGRVTGVTGITGDQALVDSAIEA